MIPTSELHFLQALEICQSLREDKFKPSTVPCRAIELFCQIAQEPWALLALLPKYSLKVQAAQLSLEDYATSVDNWSVKGEACPLGFGVKDHCNILSFFLNLDRPKFSVFSGNFTNPEIICEFLQEYRGIDLSVVVIKPLTPIS